MAEWIYEDGIGEARAALVHKGRIVEAQIERGSDQARAGAVASGRMVEQRIAKLRGIVRLDSGEDVLLEPIPPKLTEGGRVTVEILREAIIEPGRAKLAKARGVKGAAKPAPGKKLLQRIRMTGHNVLMASPHDAEDRLEEAGWSELLEEAASGEVTFDGGALRIALTPAMTVIDIDGPLKPAELARRGSAAAADAIRRMGLAGSIGIDFPTLEEKAARAAIADAFDAVLPQPFERTAVNGFGLMQVVRRRERASLAELIQYGPLESVALALLRQAERAKGSGTATVTAHPSVITLLESRPDWGMALARSLGREIRLASDASLGIHGGHVS